MIDTRRVLGYPFKRHYIGDKALQNTGFKCSEKAIQIKMKKEKKKTLVSNVHFSSGNIQSPRIKEIKEKYCTMQCLSGKELFRDLRQCVFSTDQGS